jgi:two-component sensor histidine kinase
VAVEALRESRNRVLSMALIHEQLYQAGDFAQIDFGEYVGHLVSNLARAYSREVKTEIEADQVLLGIDSAVPCSLILNELVTNAFKHAFPPSWEPSTDGRYPWIRITLSSSEDRQITLGVSDNGVGMSSDLDLGAANSLGMMLVQSLVSQLDGEIELGQVNGLGTTFRLSFSPLQAGQQ